MAILDLISQVHLPSSVEKKWKYNEAVHQLFTDFRTAYDSFRREVLYNILIEYGIPLKLVRPIKTSKWKLKKTPGKQTFVRYVSYKEWFETRRCFIAVAFQFCFRMRHWKGSSKPGVLEIKWNTSAFILC
jgi:hypothetical protein